MEGWPDEATVQNVFAGVLENEGWIIDHLANTKAREHGIDVLAHKGLRRLGAEVKGFPSIGYADPAKAGQKNRAKPNHQAKLWYGKALYAAIILRDAEPDWESLIVLPDCPRYRELVAETARSVHAVGVHVVLLSPDGSWFSESWSA